METIFLNIAGNKVAFNVSVELNLITSGTQFESCGELLANIAVLDKNTGKEVIQYYKVDAYNVNYIRPWEQSETIVYFFEKLDKKVKAVLKRSVAAYKKAHKTKK